MRGFAGAGLRARITEKGFFNFRAIIVARGLRIFFGVAHGRMIKITDERCAMMLRNEIDDLLRKLVFAREIDAILHMRNNQQRADGRLQALVSQLCFRRVLNEIFRLSSLSKIMVEHARADEPRVRANGIGCRFCEEPDLQRMSECAGRFELNELQSGLVHVGEFEEPDVGQDTKERLN